MLPCLVSVVLTFEIQGVLKFKKKSVAKRLMEPEVGYTPPIVEVEKEWVWTSPVTIHPHDVDRNNFLQILSQRPQNYAFEQLNRLCCFYVCESGGWPCAQCTTLGVACRCTAWTFFSLSLYFSCLPVWPFSYILVCSPDILRTSLWWRSCRLYHY